jgi:hypothetical protein
MVLKNFPAAMLWRVPFASFARYWWHLVEMLAGRGKGAEFRQAGHSAALLPWLVVRAHLSALVRLPRLLRDRNRIPRKLSAAEFCELADRHSIAMREVAAL